MRVSFIALAALALGGCPPEVRSSSMVGGFDKARAAFGEYAAGVLGVKSKKVNVGPPSEAAADGLQIPTDTGTLSGKVGRAWPFDANSPEKPGQSVRGWATPDGQAIALKQSLGVLFEEAGFWSGKAVNAVEMAQRLLWSTGMGSGLAQGRPAPELKQAQDGTGTLVFYRSYSPPGGGSFTFVFECKVALTADHRATFTSSENLNK